LLILYLVRALHKTSHVLLGLSQIVESTSNNPPITYYALDLEKRELERTLNEIELSIGTDLKGKVETKGMWGTYDDGLKFLQSVDMNLTSERLSRLSTPNFKIDARDLSPDSSASDSSESPTSNSVSPPSTPEETQPPLHIMFLGSSLGNFNRADGAAFLRSLPLRPGSGDTLLLGLDHDNEKSLIEKAYNDSRDHTKKFIMNGLRGAGRVLGNESLFSEEKWDYVNRYNEIERRHEAFYKSKISHTMQIPSSDLSIDFQENELIKVEESWKVQEASYLSSSLR
jgi:L-histidine Nalpha-methyltransferase / hercynylcysteine S-oxide synthase